MLSTLIVGCGNIAGGFDAGRPAEAGPLTHAGAFQRHGGFALTACVDPDAARREVFAARWGVQHTAASVAALATAPGTFDVISICSPNAVHAEHLEAAIALAPRLIFCEKPVTGNADATEALVARCHDAGILLAVNYTRRWAPDVVALAGELTRGERGAVRSVVGTYTKGVLHNGGHLIDLLHLLFGPLTLTAAGDPVHDHWHDDPSVPALLAAQGGVPIQLGIGDARDYALFELVVVTERGEIAMRDGGLHWTEREPGASAAFAGYRTLGGFAERPGRYDEAMSAAVGNIADALMTGAPLASTGDTALAAQRLCEQISTAGIARLSDARKHR